MGAVILDSLYIDVSRSKLTLFFSFYLAFTFNDFQFAFLSANQRKQLISCWYISFLFNPGVRSYPDIDLGILQILLGNNLILK